MPNYVVCPDVSAYQVKLDGTYTRDILIFRVTFGAHYLDPNFLANASAAAKLYRDGRIAGVLLYHVYTADPVKDQLDFTWSAIGPKVPDWLVGIELDAELWRGQSYELRGDHSRQLNQLYALHAHKMGSWSSCIGYGNRGDLAELWPGRDKRCHVIVASYGSQLVLDKVPGAIGQQYTDGQTKWPVPRLGGKLLPRTTPPFGPADHNVFPGFANGKALRAVLRPVKRVVKPPVPVIPKPPAKPPAPKPPTPPPPKPKPPAPAPPYNVLIGDRLVSKSGHHTVILHDDGTVERRTDHHHATWVQQSPN